MSAEFVACMEDVLDLYAEPYDSQRPVVCFDETSKQLVAEKRSPIPAKAGRQERFDYEYQRNGTRNLFMTCEPLAGWRHVAVTERRSMEDFAHQMRWLMATTSPGSNSATDRLHSMKHSWKRSGSRRENASPKSLPSRRRGCRGTVFRGEGPGKCETSPPCSCRTSPHEPTSRRRR